MKHILQLTTAFSLVLGLTALSTNAQAQNLQQPVALTTASTTGLIALGTLEEDSQVTPTGCCESGTGCSGNGCCANGCCDPVCCPRCVVEDVEKKCWNVDCEFICVPRFRWPWECRGDSKQGCDASRGCSGDGCCGDGCCDSDCCCGCPPKCGKVRCVNVLEEHKYTCKECGYKWNVKCVRSGSGCSCRGGCCPECGCGPGCGDCAANDATKEVQLTAATTTAPAAPTVADSPKARLSLLERLGLK